MTKPQKSSIFFLQGFTSIQIGLYFLLTSYLIKIILEGFLTDDNPVGMFSPEILEYVITSICILFFLFSSLALYFSAKRRAKKQETRLLNGISKIIVRKYLAVFFLLFMGLIFLLKQGLVDVITPVFLLLYGFILWLFNPKRIHKIMIISGICWLLTVICFLIPNYWFASLSILGIVHLTYGIVEGTDPAI